MSKFKVREAKTVGGYDAFIFEIGDQWMFGKVNEGGWRSFMWSLDGASQSYTSYDLLSNHDPLRAEFEDVVKKASFYSNGEYLRLSHNIVIVPEEFADKRVKVTLESLE